MSLNKKTFPSAAAGITLSEHYDVLTWTGTGTGPGDSRNITGLSFAPDFAIIIEYHTSGSQTKYIISRKFGTNADGEVYYYALDSAGNLDVSGGRFTGWLSNGFKVGYQIDQSGDKWMAFCWKVNGNTANPDVNLDSGVSTRTYTGNGSYRNMSHGLGTSNVFPIIKRRQGYEFTARPIGVSWTDYFNISDGGLYDDYWTWQDTGATSSSIRLGVRERVNSSGYDYDMFNFTPIAGASDYGTYTGNGSSTDGPEINCGFQPSIVILGTAKEGQNTKAVLCSNRHQTDNSNLKSTILSDTSAWYTSSAVFEFTSTGFQINSQYGTWNGNGDNYWYFAWADPDIVG